MNSRFKITDNYSPQKMKKKKLTMRELLLLQKNKRDKTKILHLEKNKREETKILHLEKKKRGFTLAELSPQPVMRKKIKNTIPRRHARFTISDIPSPPKQSSNSSLSSPNISESISPTPCCSCLRIMKKGDKTPEHCNWCKLKFHLHKCITKNTKERRRTEKQEIKTLMQKMKRQTI